MSELPSNGSDSRLANRKWKGHVSFVTDLRVQASFNETSLTLSREFRREGLLVTMAPRFTPLSEVKGADILLAHPGWSQGEFNFGTNGTAKRFGLRGFIDVTNYSHPGPKAQFQLAHPFWDFIAVHWIPPGLEIEQEAGKVVRWDLGLPREYAAPVGPVRKRPRIFIHAQNGGWERKGHDIHATILAEAQRRGYDFDVFVKTPFVDKVRKWFSDVRKVHVIGYYLNRTASIRLLDEMDILLHLNRGGGWEMVPMEALARGLVTLVPGEGCIPQYANGCSLMIETHPWTPPQRWILKDSGGCDAGIGYEVDANRALDCLYEVLNQWPRPGHKAKRNAPVFYEEWRIERVMPKNWAVLDDKLGRTNEVLARIREKTQKPPEPERPFA